MIQIDIKGAHFRDYLLSQWRSNMSQIDMKTQEAGG